jgi:chaperonin GroES
MVNESGYIPVGHRVLIKLDPKVEKTLGGILMPEIACERENNAANEGTVAAIGDTVFEGYCIKPVVGDRVIFNKYAGVVITGKDGERYRIIDDENDIAAIKEKEHE